MSLLPNRPVRLLSFDDDQPTERKGSLIPESARAAEKRRAEARITTLVNSVALPVVAVLLLSFAVVSSYGLVSARHQVAAPTVTIVDPQTFHKVTVPYGPQAALSQQQFFIETRDAFIDESISFIEIDLDARTLRYFENGVLTRSAEIVGVGETGSWWDAPSGLYQVEQKDDYEFSSLAQVYFPWAITFEGNYAIHGWPEYPDRRPVTGDVTVGGIRIDNAVAAALYAAVEPGTPVIVHQEPDEVEQFIYQPTVQNVTAPHYLIADIDNNTVLAASDLDEVVPIASLTKLMTAVVAAEKMDLDSRVQVTAPHFVESLIPRLRERTSVSMYSLLQLLLVESSNEAAEVIASEYGREAFVEQMNQKAKQLGMFRTTFADPSGLSAANTSSLGDVFRLSQDIHHNRKFIFDITADGTLESVSGLGEFAHLVNFNEIENVDNFAGGKIGETIAAGKTSVSLHDIDVQGSQRRVIIILLGATARDQDVQTLLSFANDRFAR